jgi:hypothetical protein
MAFFNTPLRDFRLLLDGLRHGVQGEFHLVLLEQAEHTPEATATAVFEFGLDIQIPLVDSGWRGGILTQIVFGLAVALHHVEFAALFAIYILENGCPTKSRGKAHLLIIDHE